jgi:hypothetical protein
VSELSPQQTDFLKIKQMIGKVSPKELGQLLGQYYSRYLKENETAKVENYSEALKLFDGTLFGKSIDNTN